MDTIKMLSFTTSFLFIFLAEDDTLLRKISLLPVQKWVSNRPSKNRRIKVADIPDKLVTLEQGATSHLQLDDKSRASLELDLLEITR
jgi:hypothetical protein